MSSNRSLTSSGGLCWRSENTSLTTQMTRDICGICNNIYIYIFLQTCHTWSYGHCEVENIIPGRDQWWEENQMELWETGLLAATAESPLQLKRWCLFLAGGLLPRLEATELIWPSCLIILHWMNSGVRFSIIVYHIYVNKLNRCDSHQIKVAQHTSSFVYLVRFAGHFTASHSPWWDAVEKIGEKTLLLFSLSPIKTEEKLQRICISKMYFLWGLAYATLSEIKRMYNVPPWKKPQWIHTLLLLSGKTMKMTMLFLKRIHYQRKWEQWSWVERITTERKRRAR